MEIYIQDEILYFKDKSYSLEELKTNVSKKLVSKIRPKNAVNMKGKLATVYNKSVVWDFGWYKYSGKYPEAYLPKGVWTKNGNTYYNSFLLLTGCRECSAKCLKCGKLIKGTFKDLDKHAEVCECKHLEDKVDHTWKLLGNFKYYNAHERDKCKGEIQ